MRRILVYVLFAAQALCAVVFVSDIVISVMGLRAVPIDWRARELIEIGAAIGLMLGTVMGFVVLFRSDALRRRSDARRLRVEESLRVAQGAFSRLVGERFDAWGLTPAERDVATFAIKGLGLSDIAAMRGTSEGTVKAQSAAIYRKAGVSSRAQLVSLFLEELMEGPLPGTTGATVPAAATTGPGAPAPARPRA